MELQGKNVIGTGLGTAWKYVTSLPGLGIGPIAGPLMTVVSGTDTLGEGISTVTEAGRTRDQRIHDQSGGYFDAPEPAPQPAGHAPGADTASEPAGQSSDPAEAQRHSRGKREADRILENIRIKQQLADQGSANGESWKDWR